ncbi:MAG: hypothetical protein QXE24_03010 [Desulfurococcaceae archaeon]
MNTLFELAVFGANAFLLLLEGSSDLKLRGVPVVLLVAHGFLAAASMIYRLVTGDLHQVILAYAVISGLILLLLLVYFSTGFIGESDIAVIATSSFTSPYVFIGFFRYLGLVAPLAILTSSAYLLYKYRRTTGVVYLKGLGKTRARLRYAVDFKVSNLLRYETPIYIENYGVIPREVVRNAEKLREILDNVNDYTIVYSVPNYPYVYYYSLTYIVSYLALTLISLVLGVVIA